MRWFKFYGQDWHTDPKIAGMGMEDRLCLLALLTIAAAEEKNGLIPSLTEDSLIKLAGIPDWPQSDYNPMERAIGCLERYESLRIVTLGGNNEVTVRNWGARQGGNNSNAEKQRRYRERLKLRATNTSNVTVTESNTVVTPLPRIEENRIDKNTCGEDAAPRVVSTSEEDNARGKRETRSADKLTIYHLFSKKEQPWWRHAQQKKAALSLFDLLGVEKVRAGLQLMRDFEDEKDCPQASTPFEYEEKLPKLTRFVKRHGL